MDNMQIDLAALQGQIETLTAMLASGGPMVADRTSYSVEEVARMLGREIYTVREWCRLGRINASKAKGERCGPHQPWRITATKVNRFRNDGLLPLDMHRNREGRASQG